MRDAVTSLTAVVRRRRRPWDAVHVDRISNGKIVEHWVIQDQLGMLQQLGFMPGSE